MLRVRGRLTLLVAALQVASAFWCPVWRLDGGGYTRRQSEVSAQVHRTWCCDPMLRESGGGAQLRWKRRLVLRTAGCAAGGLLLPASGSSAVSDRFSPSAIRSVSVVAEDEETKRANLDMLDFFSSQEMPFALNELDSATVEALSREEEFLRDEEKLASDAIFTFRGEQLLKTNPEGAVRYMSRRNAVFFGETHDSSRDKRLATRILRQLKMKRGSVALGLEMVQQPFQPVLDWYVYRAPPSKAADRTLFRETEWESRWGWDFEGYLPILRYAQLHKVPMIALNVEAELTARVRKQGLPALSAAERERLIMDLDGFRYDTIAPSFNAYVDAVLRPSFDAHLAMGMFQDTGNAFSNFVSNRILWDETMASVASRFLLRHPDYLLVGLVGGDHIKTAHGIPARIERILTNYKFDNARTTSVALNPSWKLYTASRKLVEVDRRERLVQEKSGEMPRRGGPADSAAQDGERAPGLAARRGSGDLLADGNGAASAPQRVGGEGWREPPPAGQHPFSDIIWFS